MIPYNQKAPRSYRFNPPHVPLFRAQEGFCPLESFRPVVWLVRLVRIAVQCHISTIVRGLTVKVVIKQERGAVFGVRGVNPGVLFAFRILLLLSLMIINTHTLSLTPQTVIPTHFGTFMHAVKTVL